MKNEDLRKSYVDTTIIFVACANLELDKQLMNFNSVWKIFSPISTHIIKDGLPSDLDHFLWVFQEPFEKVNFNH